MALCPNALLLLFRPLYEYSSKAPPYEFILGLDPRRCTIVFQIARGSVSQRKRTFAVPTSEIKAFRKR